MHLGWKPDRFVEGESSRGKKRVVNLESWAEDWLKCLNKEGAMKELQAGGGGERSLAVCRTLQREELSKK